MATNPVCRGVYRRQLSRPNQRRRRETSGSRLNSSTTYSVYFHALYPNGDVLDFWFRSSTTSQTFSGLNLPAGTFVSIQVDAVYVLNRFHWAVVGGVLVEQSGGTTDFPTEFSTATCTIVTSGGGPSVPVLTDPNMWLVAEDANAWNLYVLNANTGRATLLHRLSLQIDYEGLAVHNDVLYTVGKDTEELYRINVSTGVVTFDSTVQLEDEPKGLTSFSNSLFKVGAEELRLLRLNETTDRWARSSPEFVDIGDATSLAVYNNAVHMLGQVYEAGILDGTGPWHLFRFSSVTGQPTRVSSSVFDFGVAEIDEAHTLGVKDGQMYLSMSISNSTTHRFYYVNPAVGDASRVGTLTNFGVGVRKVAGIEDAVGYEPGAALPPANLQVVCALSGTVWTATATWDEPAVSADITLNNYKYRWIVNGVTPNTFTNRNRNLVRELELASTVGSTVALEVVAVYERRSTDTTTPEAGVTSATVACGSAQALPPTNLTLLCYQRLRRGDPDPAAARASWATARTPNLTLLRYGFRWVPNGTASADDDTTALSTTNTDLVEGDTVRFDVWAVYRRNADGMLINSPEVSRTVRCIIPNPPTNVEVECEPISFTRTRATATWDPPTATPAGLTFLGYFHQWSNTHISTGPISTRSSSTFYPPNVNARLFVWSAYRFTGVDDKPYFGLAQDHDPCGAQATSTYTPTPVMAVCHAPEGLRFPVFTDRNVAIAWSRTDVDRPEAFISAFQNEVAVGSEITLGFRTRLNTHWRVYLDGVLILSGTGPLNSSHTILATEEDLGPHTVVLEAENQIATVSYRFRYTVVMTTITPTVTPTPTATPSVRPRVSISIKNPAYVGDENVTLRMSTQFAEGYAAFFDGTLVLADTGDLNYSYTFPTLTDEDVDFTTIRLIATNVQGSNSTTVTWEVKRVGTDTPTMTPSITPTPGSHTPTPTLGPCQPPTVSISWNPSTVVVGRATTWSAETMRVDRWHIRYGGESRNGTGDLNYSATILVNSRQVGTFHYNIRVWNACGMDEDDTTLTVVRPTNTPSVPISRPCDIYNNYCSCSNCGCSGCNRYCVFPDRYFVSTAPCTSRIDAACASCHLCPENCEDGARSGSSPNCELSEVVRAGESEGELTITWYGFESWDYTQDETFIGIITQDQGERYQMDDVVMSPDGNTAIVQLPKHLEDIDPGEVLAGRCVTGPESVPPAGINLPAGIILPTDLNWVDNTDPHEPHSRLLRLLLQDIRFYQAVQEFPLNAAHPSMSSVNLRIVAGQYITAEWIGDTDGNEFSWYLRVNGETVLNGVSLLNHIVINHDTQMGDRVEFIVRNDLGKPMVVQHTLEDFDVAVAKLSRQKGEDDQKGPRVRPLGYYYSYRINGGAWTADRFVVQTRRHSGQRRGFRRHDGVQSSDGLQPQSGLLVGVGLL